MTPAATKLKLWREDPAQMVRDLFGVEPDAWQLEALTLFPHKPRLAMLACKGPGKTTVLSWLAWNFLLTRPRPKIAATSVTADNLSDGLWTEMAKWQAKSPLLQRLFVWTKTRIFAKEAPEEWWMSARTWAKGASVEQQANTLAGLHADYILFLIDESGSVPTAVMAAAEAALASCVEGHLVQAGNPTTLDGPLYAAATREAHLWHTIRITSDPDDPHRTPRVSVQWAREQIDKYGRDNPWVLVNVFGRFPPGSINALLTVDEVTDAMRRKLPVGAYEHAARILGVDVARQGDDKTVIAMRQGLYVHPFISLRNEDSHQVAGRVAMEYDEWDADSIQIDSTGGYGWGVIDALRTMNRRAVAVEFAGKPLNAGFLNKRAEMWWSMAEWVKTGGALPYDPELLGELTSVTYSFKGDKIQIEAKDQIKERIGRSPDLSDALACTFAQPVTARSIKREMKSRPRRSSASSWAV